MITLTTTQLLVTVLLTGFWSLVGLGLVHVLLVRPNLPYLRMWLTTVTNRWWNYAMRTWGEYAQLAPVNYKRNQWPTTRAWLAVLVMRCIDRTNLWLCEHSCSMLARMGLLQLPAYLRKHTAPACNTDRRNS